MYEKVNKKFSDICATIKKRLILRVEGMQQGKKRSRSSPRQRMPPNRIHLKII